MNFFPFFFFFLSLFYLRYCMLLFLNILFIWKCSNSFCLSSGRFIQSTIPLQKSNYFRLKKKVSLNVIQSRLKWWSTIACAASEIINCSNILQINLPLKWKFRKLTQQKFYMYWGTEDKASDSRWKILVVGSATMRKC